ncbi:MAG: hypothetical protein JNN25_12135 [Candidatus Kapabacteria bacterium]|nr:hypothetical protein [Candidatus Kapabacteria bacterium]
MWQDPIVEEVRLEHEKYAASLNFDLNAIVADLQEQQIRSGRIVVELDHTVGEERSKDVSRADFDAVPQRIPKAEPEEFDRL